MVQVPFFSSFTFIFKVKLWHFISFSNISQKVKDRESITIVIDGDIANVVRRDIDVRFQGYTVLKCLYLKNGELAKNALVRLIGADIHHRTGQL